MDPVEERFLAMLRADPADDTTRLVYADWLEGHGDQPRADFLRVVCKLANPNVHRKKAPVLHERLVELSTSSDAAWRAMVSRPPIDKCTVEFRFKCPKQWSALTPTDAPTVRHCDTCEREVHFCASLEDVRFHAAQGDCVAFDPALRNGPADSVYDRESSWEDHLKMEMDIGEIEPYPPRGTARGS